MTKYMKEIIHKLDSIISRTWHI